jgi:hypothetical protein
MANDIQNIKDYTKSDFIETTLPYEFVYRLIDDKFQMELALEKMSEIARNVGIKNFKTLYKNYCRSMKSRNGENYSENVSNFTGQPFELITEGWRADDFGIVKDGPFGGEIIACVHPIMPVKRLINIDGGVEKLEIAFRKGYQWRKEIFDRKQLASANSIVPSLSDRGVAVTSESAKHLVQFLHDVENRNYDKIPESMSVTRLGWIGEYGFSPYMDNIIFDGEASFRHRFESVKQHGNYDAWLKAVKKIRSSGNVPAKMLLAASFASVLVEPCGGLPFFVHLFGGTGTGKTVGMMLAASVWADPEMGRYVHTFNSTMVAQELSAGFVNSMPLILDELQIIKDKKDFDQIIYQLSEGVGRSRGQKTGGLQRTTTWQNCIITSGEQPISNSNSGGGAINRIIEISCDDVNLFDEPDKLVAVLRKNYGYAGKKFIEELMKPNKLELAKELQEKMYQDLLKTDVTEKQALAASLILVADALIDDIIFDDGCDLSVKEVSAFLSTHAEVSTHVRAFAWLNDWIAQHGSKFDESNSPTSEVWGKYSHGKLYIIRDKFDSACRERGFNAATFLPWLKKNGHLDTRERGFTRQNTINRAQCECVVLLRNCLFDDDDDE